MHSDAKFGLIVGVVLVLAVAVLFFSKEGAQPPNPALAKTAEANTPPSAAALLPAPTPIAKPKTPGQTTSRKKEMEQSAEAPRRQR